MFLKWNEQPKTVVCYHNPSNLVNVEIHLDETVRPVIKLNSLSSTEMVINNEYFHV